MNLGVDDGIHPARVLRDTPRQPPEAEGDSRGEGGHGDQQQRQRGVDRQQIDDEHHHQQQLAEQVQCQVDDLGEILGVRRDAADDLARWVLVVERHIVAHGGIEHVLAQLQHGVARHAGREQRPNVVEHPGRRADEADPQGDEGHNSHRAAAEELRFGGRLQQAHSASDDNWPQRAHDRVEGDHHRDDDHAAAVGAEVAENAVQQLPVAILPVVAFGFQSVENEAHLKMALLRRSRSRASR